MDRSSERIDGPLLGRRIGRVRLARKFVNAILRGSDIILGSRFCIIWRRKRRSFLTRKGMVDPSELPSHVIRFARIGLGMKTNIFKNKYSSLAMGQVALWIYEKETASRQWMEACIERLTRNKRKRKKLLEILDEMKWPVNATCSICKKELHGDHGMLVQGFIHRPICVGKKCIKLDVREYFDIEGLIDVSNWK